MSDDRAKRRRVAMLLSIILLALILLPGTKARVVVTAAQTSILLDSGTVRFWELVSNGWPEATTVAVSTGAIAQ